MPPANEPPVRSRSPPRSRAARRARGRAGADAAAPGPSQRTRSPHRSSQVAVPRTPVGPDPAGHRGPGGLGRRRRHGGRPAARRRRQTPSRPAKVMQASALSGTGGVATTMKPGARGPVVSRDSRRDAQSDAAGDDVVRRGRGRRSRSATPRSAELAKQTEKYAAKLKLNLWHLPVVGYHLTATLRRVRPLVELPHGSRLRRSQRHPDLRGRQRRDHLRLLRRCLRQQDGADPR